MDIAYFIFLMLIYAIIPGIPAVILRIKFPLPAFKIIAMAAAAFGLICFLLIVSGGEMLIGDNNWIAVFAQCVLTSTVPVLFCIAFYGLKWEILIALLPSILYIAAFFIRFFMTYGVVETLEYFVAEPDDPTMMIMIVMSVVFFAWALLGIFVSNTIYKRFDQRENKSLLK